MPKVKDLNPSVIGRIGGSDLAIPFLGPDGKTWFVWGDTFDGNTPAINSGPDWRSPVITRAPNRANAGSPIVFDSAAKGGAQLWPYQHNNPEFSTVLPCDAITIGNRVYLWVMVTRGLGNERWCEIWYTDNNGETWHNGTHYNTPGVGSSSWWNTSHFGGKRTMLTWTGVGNGWVHAISTGGLARDKNAIMWRVREADILNKTKWEGWVFENGSWRWKIDPPNPSNILPDGTRLGEIGFRRIQNHWVFSGFDAGNYRAFVKIGYGPIENINWFTTPTIYPVRGNWQGFGTYDTVDRLYGCYVDPNSRLVNPDGSRGTFAMIVSTWAQSGNPYRAMQYRFPAPNTLGPV